MPLNGQCGHARVCGSGVAVFIITRISERLGFDHPRQVYLLSAFVHLDYLYDALAAKVKGYIEPIS